METQIPSLLSPLPLENSIGTTAVAWSRGDSPCSTTSSATLSAEDEDDMATEKPKKPSPGLGLMLPPSEKPKSRSSSSGSSTDNEHHPSFKYGRQIQIQPQFPTNNALFYPENQSQPYQSLTYTNQFNTYTPPPGQLSWSAEHRASTSYNLPSQIHGLFPTPGPNYRHFIESTGIHPVVITRDLQSYLGPDALMRPVVRNGVRGYEISAYRTFTTAMIHDLREDTIEYEKNFMMTAPMVSEEGCFGTEEEAEVEIENGDVHMDLDHAASGHAQTLVDEDDDTLISTSEMDDLCSGDFVQNET